MPARVWRIALLVLMIAIVGLAVRPLVPRESPEVWFPHADKLHHLWLFGLLWWMGLKAGYRPGGWLALGLLAYGASIEIVQSLTSTRQAQGLDLVADSVGIALGWGLTLWRLARQPQEDRG